MNFKQKAAVAILDAAILVELTGCLYWSNRYGEDLTRMFLLTYLPTVLVTMIIGKLCINRLRAPEGDNNHHERLDTISDYSDS